MKIHDIPLKRAIVATYDYASALDRVAMLTSRPPQPGMIQVHHEVDDRDHNRFVTVIWVHP